MRTGKGTRKLFVVRWKSITTPSPTRRLTMSLPSPIIQVLLHFRPAFTRPTWDKALTLVVGTILARGRRTVTAALKQMGLHDEPDFTLFHQVLNRASWS